MEKSLRKAEVTRTTAPTNTAPKLVMPARRAVSLSRSEPGCLRMSATSPARKEYALRARARRRTKLPNSAMIELHFSRIAGRTQRPFARGATFVRETTSDFVKDGQMLANFDAAQTSSGHPQTAIYSDYALWARLASTSRSAVSQSSFSN